jgi:uncharacterized protein YecA (UPF0149 family)
MGAIADAIMAYAQPLIDETDGSIEELNKALAMSQLCWNLAIVPKESRQSVLDDMQSSLQMSDAEFEDFERSVVSPMIRRHEEMFPKLHGRQSLEPPHWESSLPSVAKMKPAKATPSQPGRYDPCPCNSGKKYKFCCSGGRG